jgi:hypothetical protein
MNQPDDVKRIRFILMMIPALFVRIAITKRMNTGVGHNERLHSAGAIL